MGCPPVIYMRLCGVFSGLRQQKNRPEEKSSRKGLTNAEVFGTIRRLYSDSGAIFPSHP